MRQGTDRPESISNPANNLYAGHARLDDAIKALIVDLINCGGTRPSITYDVLLDDYPELCGLFDPADVVSRCRQIQQAELPEESKRLQELYRVFNDLYFDSRLPTYEVHSVYDVNFWANEYFEGEEFSWGYHDEQNRRIFVRHGLSSTEIDSTLLHEMAHVAAGGDHGEEWLGEMRRLQALGAPVWAYDLEPDDPQRKNGPQIYSKKRLTSNDVFGNLSSLD